MSPRIAEFARSNSNEPVQALVRFARLPGETERRQIEAQGGTLTRSYANFPLATIRAPANRLLQVANSIGVSFVDDDAVVYGAANGSFNNTYGQTSRVPGRSSGTGSAQPVSTTLGVAIVDSGVSTHADVNVASRVTLADARNSLVSTYRDDFMAVRFDGSTGTDPWYEFAWVEASTDGGTTWIAAPLAALSSAAVKFDQRFDLTATALPRPRIPSTSRSITAATSQASASRWTRAVASAMRSGA